MSLEHTSTDTLPTKPRSGFGVGCFHFAMWKQPPFRFEMHDYIKELRAALQRVTTINNIEIEYDEDQKGFDIETGEQSSLEEGDHVFPHPDYLEISFDVYIPFRIQEELTEVGIASETQSENFRLHIRYTYYGPVAYVQPLDATDTTLPFRPSIAVRVVREYLTKELKNNASTITFQCIGPSPFHANFYLLSTPTKTEESFSSPFHVELSRPRDYAQLVFDYPASHFPDSDTALYALFSELEDELGLFYKMIQSGRSARGEWDTIQDRILALTYDTPEVGILKKIRNKWKRGQVLHQLHRDLVAFDINHLLQMSDLERSYRETYSIDEPRYLESFLKKEIQDRQVFPTKQVGQLVTFLEKRRSKALELFIILSASLIGGVAGSLITLLAKK